MHHATSKRTYCVIAHTGMEKYSDAGKPINGSSQHNETFDSWHTANPRTTEFTSSI